MWRGMYSAANYRNQLWRAREDAGAPQKPLKQRSRLMWDHVQTARTRRTLQRANGKRVYFATTSGMTTTCS